MTDETEAPDSSAACDALLQKGARQSSGQPLLVAGKKLSGGRFEIRRRIGQRGMGVVYEAFDATRREKVALKTLSRLRRRVAPPAG